MEDYLGASNERGKDAAQLRDARRQLAAVYMAGYVVECKLKALLVARNLKFRMAGSGGHNLHALWEAAGLRRLDLSGNRRAFLDVWGTHLRYQTELPSPPEPDFESLYAGAIELAGWIQSRMRNSGRRR